jgi:hypothetical protein
MSVTGQSSLGSTLCERGDGAGSGCAGSRRQSHDGAVPAAGGHGCRGTIPAPGGAVGPGRAGGGEPGRGRSLPAVVLSARGGLRPVPDRPGCLPHGRADVAARRGSVRAGPGNRGVAAAVHLPADRGNSAGAAGAAADDRGGHDAHHGQHRAGRRGADGVLAPPGPAGRGVAGVGGGLAAAAGATAGAGAQRAGLRPGRHRADGLGDRGLPDR